MHHCCLMDLSCDPFLQDEELYKLFCGISNLESSIEAVRVVRDPHLNVGKGIAYVLFKTKVCCSGARLVHFHEISYYRLFYI